MLRDLVDRVFDGSATSVMLSLLEATDIDPEKLEQVRQIIEPKVRKKS
jgi:hypothetical protein